jgi:acyl-coenzyme A synthetase/AMP-(fatty) acid ligase
VIGKPDPIRGEIIKAFIALREGYHETPDLMEEIRQFVRNGLSAHSAPREIESFEQIAKDPIRQNYAPGFKGTGIRPAYWRSFYD